MRRDLGICVECGEVPARSSVRCYICNLINEGRTERFRLFGTIRNTEKENEIVTENALQGFITKVEKMGYSEGLGMTYLEAAQARYRERIAAARRIGEDCVALVEPLGQICREVADAQSDRERVAILEPAPMGDAPPAHQSYSQYQMPMDTGLI